MTKNRIHWVALAATACVGLPAGAEEVETDDNTFRFTNLQSMTAEERREYLADLPPTPYERWFLDDQRARSIDDAQQREAAVAAAALALKTAEVEARQAGVTTHAARLGPLLARTRILYARRGAPPEGWMREEVRVHRITRSGMTNPAALQQCTTRLSALLAQLAPARDDAESAVRAALATELQRPVERLP